MAGGHGAQLLEALDLTNSRYPSFYRSPDALESAAPPLPYTHAVCRAWEAMRLDGVLYVDRAPAAYFREVREITDDLARGLQRSLWNHAIAPLLVLVSPREVRVYSGQALPARPDEDPQAGSRLVEILDRTSQALEIRQLLHAIETGQVFTRKPESFVREHSVDRVLLQNLDALRKKLAAGTQGLKPKVLHRLLTRVLFTCYLVERGIVLGKHFSDPILSGLSEEGGLRGVLADLKPARAKQMLYRLFGRLEAKFNGSLFEADLAGEAKAVKDEHMAAIQRFLQGHDVGTGQLFLGFWAYDFSIIPVETISAIYEAFIEAEGSAERRHTGAYYTPPHLAELVVDAAVEGRKQPLLDATVLDPACGSGVFLVSVFNRMAQEWRQKNPNCRNGTRARALKRILQSQLFGVDVNETACRISCFSLYLALLDQLEPRDIEELEAHGEKLPVLLLPKDEGQPPSEPRTIVCRSFFDPQLPLARQAFDIVIGNPPWVSRRKVKDQFFLEWMSVCPEVRAPQKQMAHGFMWKVPKRLTEGGKACFLLPSAVLLNRTDVFQKAWFADFTAERVINLSDLRFLLFSGSKHPGVIMRFAGAKPDPRATRVAYETPKVDIGSQLGGPVRIWEEDTTGIRLCEILSKAERKEAPLLWKTHFWATPRDLRFLARLFDLPPLGNHVGDTTEGKRWICGPGFTPFNPKPGSDVARLEKEARPKKPWWSENRPYLDAKSESTNLLVLESDCLPVGDRFSRIQRPRHQELFNPPLVVVSHGSSKVAFVDFPLLFQHALQSIKGSGKDAWLLKFLAAVLNSQLATYFLFHTAANWGTERDKVHVFELLRLPFPLPEECPDSKRAKAIVDEVGCKIDNLKAALLQPEGTLGRQDRVQEVKKEIEPLIRKYYEVDDFEAMLIEDTLNIFEPSSTPASPGKRIRTLRQTTPEDRRLYASILCDMLNTWGDRGEVRVSAKVTYAPSAGQAIVTVYRTTTPKRYAEENAPDDLKAIMQRVATVLPQHSGGFTRLRGLKVFEGQEIHILKPLTFRSWTRTAALNDADGIAAAILGRRGSP